MNNLSKAVLKNNKKNIKKLIENNSDIVPLVHNFGMSKNINNKNVSHASTLVEMHNTLSKFGLNKNEINVYLFLLRFGQQKASRISENLGITRSETYKVLHRLESKGIILRLVQKPYKYLSIPLEEIFNMFINKEYEHVKTIETEKEDILEKWKLIKKKSMNTEINTMIFQVLEGTNHIYIKLKELFDGCSDKFNMAVSNDVLLWLYNTPFFETIESRNSPKASVSVKMITEDSDISDFVLNDVNTDTFDFKFVKDLSLPGFFISDKDEIILLIRNGPEELYAMWTNYDSLVASNEQLFSVFWDINYTPPPYSE